MRGRYFFVCFFIHLWKEKRCVEIRKIFVCCLVLFCLLLTACAQNEPIPCREILNALTESEIGLPAGQIYDVCANEGDGEYLDERVINSLFGEGSAPPMRSGWLDLALFLPNSSHPCEFAIFLCDTPDTATDTARLLCRRLDAIRTSKASYENSEMLSTASVTIIGNYVIFAISSDTKNAMKIATNLIK